jgi:hypothetical protein
VIGSVCPDAASTKAFLARARAASWQMLPSHDPGLREHEWYVSASAMSAGGDQR